MHTDAAGMQAFAVPAEMSETDIEQALANHVHNSQAFIRNA